MIRPVLRTLTALPALLLAACTGGEAPAPETLYNLAANAVYAGIEDQPVRLQDGRWEGEPWVEGGASRPSVGLMRDFIITGDLDGDGEHEAVVLVWQSSGGSGTFNYIARLDFRAGTVGDIITTELGDRVQVEGGEIHDGELQLDILEHGPDDAACCPTLHTTHRYDERLQLISKKPRNTS